MVIQAYTLILDHLVRSANDTGFNPLNNEMHIKQIIARAAFAKLNKYYNVSSESCTIATILDPRLKLKFYSSDRRDNAVDSNVILACFKSEFDLNYAAEHDQDINSNMNQSVGFLESLYSNECEYGTQTEVEVYLSEPVSKNHSNFKVMDFWRIESARFPNLSRMARDFLAIPGTSTASERAFSGGRQLITDFRGSLKGSTITACMLLKNWIKKWDVLVQPQLDSIE